jgi:hypothetical protein
MLAKVVEEALEGLHELIAHGFLRGDFPYTADPHKKVKPTEISQDFVLLLLLAKLQILPRISRFHRPKVTASAFLNCCIAHRWLMSWWRVCASAQASATTKYRCGVKRTRHYHTGGSIILSNLRCFTASIQTRMFLSLLHRNHIKEDTPYICASRVHSAHQSACFTRIHDHKQQHHMHGTTISDRSRLFSNRCMLYGCSKQQ